MIHSDPILDRVAESWALTGGWLEWLVHIMTRTMRAVLRLSGLRGGSPELRMSQAWLEEYDRESRKHYEDL